MSIPRKPRKASSRTPTAFKLYTKHPPSQLSTAQRSGTWPHASNRTHTRGAQTPPGTWDQLPTSPAASRICTTSVLPNKAASCKALPISVWKANESAAACHENSSACHMTSGTRRRRGGNYATRSPQGAGPPLQYFLYSNKVHIARPRRAITGQATCESPLLVGMPTNEICPRATFLRERG